MWASLKALAGQSCADLTQTRPEKKHLAHFGLDLLNGEVRDNVQAGVLEPTLAKTKIIQVCLVRL